MKKLSILKKTIKILLIIEIFLSVTSFVIKFNHFHFPYLSTLILAAAAVFIVLIGLLAFWLLITLFSKISVQ